MHAHPPRPVIDLARTLRPAASVSPTGDVPVSAVAVLLRQRVPGAALELLLIRRAEREGDAWSGHVALPGGRAEAIDTSVAATAARETCEEVGIDLNAAGAHLLGALPSLTPRSQRLPRISVYPFAWWLPNHVEVVPNEEVALARWIALDDLASPDRVIEHRLMAGGEQRSFPAISLGDDVLWGITHRIVTNLFELLAAAERDDGVDGAETESVWDYPRPPRLEPVDAEVTIELGGEVVARTREALRVLETSHPPTLYMPRDAFADGALVEAPGGATICEWKGQAAYLDVVGGDGRVERRAAWTYPRPNRAFAELADHVSVYPGRMGRCTIGGVAVDAQAGDFYGGWITPDVRGPFKGGAGSRGW